MKIVLHFWYCMTNGEILIQQALFRRFDIVWFSGRFCNTNGIKMSYTFHNFKKGTTSQMNKWSYLRLNNTSSQNGWPLIESTFCFNKMIISTATRILLDPLPSEPYIPSTHSAGGVCCYILNWILLNIQFLSPNCKIFRLFYVRTVYSSLYLS